MEENAETPDGERAGRLGRATLVMAVGTVISRGTGFVRAAVIAATLGVGLTADLFNIANGIPTTIYLLVAGGVLNAVLVPQLVRSIRNDADGGRAYAQRLSTAVLLVLFVATIALVIAAPLVVRLFLDPRFLEPDLADQYQATVDFARYCLPQVFFYGLYTLLGQILNAHHRFGPMMFAPIVNNLIAIAIFGGYFFVYGPLDPYSGEYSDAQIAWFGLGSTVGIIAQALVLLPVLRRVGVRLRLRRDLRGVGLGKAARLGAWTLGLIAVLQVTNIVVTRLATSAVAQDPEGAGFSVYTNAFLVVMVPHSIITVSVATAVLPDLSELASQDRRWEANATVVRALRLALALIVPCAALLVALGPTAMAALFGYGAAAADQDLLVVALWLFAPGLIGLTIHYVLQRGFYAYEDTRTPVFIQLAIAAVQILLAWAVVPTVETTFVAGALAAAWSVAYLAGAGVSVAVVSRRIGRLPVGSLLWLLARSLLAAGLSALVAWQVSVFVLVLLGSTTLQEAGGVDAIVSLTIAGMVSAAVYAGAAMLLRIEEIRRLADGVLHRLGASSGSGEV